MWCPTISVIFTPMHTQRPIGIFDSGFGGLTVFKSIKERLPQYDYLYLGDNARAPYGDKSLDKVYQYTLQAVKWMFHQGCPLIILACNTSSAEALRTIQQNDMEEFGGAKRVLGVIRPTAEVLGSFSKTGSVGILGTKGTVGSGIYPTEIAEFTPDVKVYQHACPMWVPVIENDEHDTDAADIFVKQDLHKLLMQSNDIDTILLGCTHYPMLIDKINKYKPENVTIVSQGDIVAESLAKYLFRHPEIEEQLTRGSNISFCTTDAPQSFDAKASSFFGKEISSQHVELN